jgi:leucine efflux protein
MLGVSDLGVFVAGTVAIVLLPGPNSLYVLSVAARSGARLAWAGAFGVFTGDAVLMLATALGAASVLQAYPMVYAVLRVAGALYLGYLGLRLMHAAWRTWQHASGPEVVADAALAQLKPVAEQTAVATYRKALLICLVNPKAILFFLSFFVQFVDPAYPHPALSFALLALVVQVASATYLAALIWGGVRLARVFGQRRRLSALLNSAVGALFVAFGLRLAS